MLQFFQSHGIILYLVDHMHSTRKTHDDCCFSMHGSFNVIITNFHNHYQYRTRMGQVETDETENGNGKLKWKTETESGNEKLKLGNGRHNCSQGYLLRMRELCALLGSFSIGN